MAIIKKLTAKEIFDSRGNPTVSVICELLSGSLGEAAIPSGVSTGEHEAYELRDNDPDKFSGKGVTKAIGNINGEILEFLSGKELEQSTLDELLINLDGTKNKKRLGANSILAVSLSFARAQANEKELPLYEHIANLYFRNNNKRIYTIPQPSFNTIEGGKHSDSGLSFQEFMLLPVKFNNIKEKVEVMHRIMGALEGFFVEDGKAIMMGDEGGFAPKISSTEEALNYLDRAIVSAGYNTDKVKIGLDVAAATFFKNGEYHFEGKILGVEEMIRVYEDLCTKYKIISIEDGINEEDFGGFALLNSRLGSSVNIVGDDLTVTNIDLIKKAIDNRSINTLLIKPNQIGTLSETLNAVKLARDNNIKVFVSHRGGETEDVFIADLAVAVSADFIKAGGPTQKERTCKYDRLVEIEAIINSQK